MPRALTITIDPYAGAMSKYYLWINGEFKKTAGLHQKVEWSGNIPDIDTIIKVRVYGIQGSQYKLGIDLPGTIDDQSLTITLPNGSYDFEIKI